MQEIFGQSSAVTAAGVKMGTTSNKQQLARTTELTSNNITNDVAASPSVHAETHGRQVSPPATPTCSCHCGQNMGSNAQGKDTSGGRKRKRAPEWFQRYVEEARKSDRERNRLMKEFVEHQRHAAEERSSLLRALNDNISKLIDKL